MSDNIINIESDSEGNISPSSKRGMESESHSLSFINGNFGSEIISLIGNSEVEGVFRDSFSKISSSSDSLKALFFREGRQSEDPIEKLMSPSILTKAEIEPSRQIREHVGDLSGSIRGERL